jgi:ribosomal protein S18 acetylase RimI-like enzyme
MTVRAAARADIPALVALVNSAYRGDSSRQGWTTEADLLGGQRTDPVTLASQLSAAESTMLVAEREARIVGCVFLERLEAGADAYLGMLTVDPQLQTSGIGAVLLAAAEAYVVETWGVSAMRMTVIAQRDALIAWYERRGYQRTGETEPFPYGDERFGLPKRDDLYFVVMRKVLGEP